MPLLRIIIIFLVGFSVNAIWENFHASLYVHYQGGAITESILLRAAFVDAVILALMCLPFLYSRTLHIYSWLLILIGFIVAVLIEWWALGTGRWAYTAAMPIIPWLHTGFTPTVQLGILGYLTFKIGRIAVRK